ncbi:replicative DNA helicase [Brevundimonas diminuta]|uniref:replicative DNA helicase n=1 Tax=Brevundimonas diminuta TaxID=293 RepID=UPI003D9AA2D7
MSQTLLAPEVAPLPHNLEAEQAILGAILFDNSVYGRVSGELTADHFYEPYHAQVYDLAGQMINEGRLADPTMMMGKLSAFDSFAANGGLRYLADLIDRAPPPHVAAQYARPIIEACTRRRMIELGGALQIVARDPEQDPFNAINAFSQRVDEAVTGASPDDHTLIDARTAAIEAVAELDHQAETGESPGLDIGIECVDQGLGGLHPNELIILAGRPSMGKTSLARAIAMATARRHPGILVPFFALEMDRRQLSRRNLSAFSHEEGTGIPYRWMRRGRDLSSEERAHLEQMGGRIPANFILDDTAVLSLDHVRRRLMSLSRRGRIGLAVIDYLQIMDLPRFHGMNQTQAIGDVTSGLKQLAKQLACPILLLSQLSRKVEERDNKRPMLSDLRDSGSIEQDASSVLFTYRDAYYLEREGPRKGESVQDHELRLHDCMRTMEVICAKSREGPIGTTRQTYIAECDVILNEGRFG